ncbi:TPA: hypothetical protein ACUODB_000505 [Streptococcus pneumoniae]|nr:hypothetical protein [Streptococcus pneumoniae]MDS2238232.1 hypothetical protein [Streptococcus pneumoniae]MDS2249459.1 hypothetical protein [Streptococcus pneumoniae]MDS2327619.1 hypothetical protein [Streptococcus pneumoniae]MDS2457928.1 hypothetical protein [Streptococcus pneumoniae]MDS2463716.1 hypothetical protein [Streptococcus pneumoniae]
MAETSSIIVSLRYIRCLRGIMRIYKSVRLASIVNVLVDDLVNLKQIELENEEGLAERAETSLLDTFPVLNGVSRNISFKVSFSSIVEMCYRNTANYTKNEWEVLANEMEKQNYKIETSTITPKLYLDNEIWNGLESYQRKLMGENNRRILRLSYIIKLVIFAGWKQYQN